MRRISKQCLTKGVELFTMLEEELMKRIKDFEDIILSLEDVQRYTRELESLTNGKVEFAEYNDRVRDFKESVETLNLLKSKIGGELAFVKEKIDTKQYEDKNINIEELDYLGKKSGAFYSAFMVSLNSLYDVKKQVDITYNQSSCFLKGNEDCEENVLECMGQINRYNNDAKIRIEQIANNISLNAKKGNLHEIFMKTSLLKANIDLLKKQKNIK